MLLVVDAPHVCEHQNGADQSGDQQRSEHQRSTCPCHDASQIAGVADDTVGARPNNRVIGSCHERACVEASKHDHRPPAQAYTAESDAGSDNAPALGEASPRCDATSINKTTAAT